MTMATTWDDDDDALLPTEAEWELRSALDEIFSRLWALEREVTNQPETYLRIEHEDMRRRVEAAARWIVYEGAVAPPTGR